MNFHCIIFRRELPAQEHPWWKRKCMWTPQSRSLYSYMIFIFKKILKLVILVSSARFVYLIVQNFLNQSVKLYTVMHSCPTPWWYRNWHYCTQSHLYNCIIYWQLLICPSSYSFCKCFWHGAWISGTVASDVWPVSINISSMVHCSFVKSTFHPSWGYLGWKELFSMVAIDAEVPELRG